MNGATGCVGHPHALRVRVEDDVSAFEPGTWDSILDPDDLLASHRFVRTCQDARIEGARYRHVVVDDAVGTAAVASLCVMDVRLDLLAPAGTRRAAEHVRRLFPGFLRLPLVVGGLPVSLNASCLRVRPGVAPGPILERLDEVANGLAGNEAGLICFKEFSDAELSVARGLEALGYFRAPSLPSCTLDLPWSSFDAYLDAMRAGYRRQVRESLRVRREHGLRVRVVGQVAPLIPELHRLYGEVMDRAAFQLERLGADFFAALARNLPETEAVLVELEDRILAYGILLHGPTRSIFLLAGIDYERNREHHAYLNVVIEVVARCLARGSRSVEMGQTSWALKTRMGAVPTRRHLLLRHRRPLLHRALRAGRSLLFPVTRVSPRRVWREVPAAVGKAPVSDGSAARGVGSPWMNSCGRVP